MVKTAGIGLLVLLLFSGSAALAKEGKGITKGEWLRVLPFDVAGYFCQPEMFFRQCFEVTEHVCIQGVTSSIDACIETIGEKMPENLDGEAQVKWGSEIMSCTASVYEQAMRKQLVFKSSKKCESSEAWTKKE
jgi:hypothetical protein